jgi:MFS family permease
MSQSSEPVALAASSSRSAWRPLRQRAFLLLWAANLAALTGSWLSDSTAAWLMTSLASSPLQVALVQSAQTLPVLLLGVLAGALADILDRRSLLVATQIWVSGVGLALFVLTLADQLTPELLLALTFANGVGMVLRMPLTAAMTPHLVASDEIEPALALQAVAMNASRIVGPVFAGILLAWLGGPWVFLLYAVISAGVAFAFARTERQQRTSSLPSERVVGAMRLGVQFARRTPEMIGVLVQGAVFSFFAISIQALLPLVARDRLGGGANTFTLLLAAIGLGAIAAVAILPRLRARLSRDALVGWSVVLHAAATLALSQATSPWLAMLAAFAGGAAWLVVFNTLSVAAQLALPDWVRARGIAVFLVSAMAGATFGGVVWGQVAAAGSIELSLAAAGAISLLAYLLIRRRYRLGEARTVDLSPARLLPDFAAVHKAEIDQGPVLVTFEYRIDPARADEFAEVMAESRRYRLRTGAIYWGVFRDVTDPARYVMHFLVDSWADRLRQIERVTAEDMLLRDRINAFHIGPEPPVMKHFIMEQAAKR